MENASKALLIAGGMLLAMMILMLLISLATTITDVAESQDKKQLTEQLVQFNKQYEAYNKTKMFGTDVITVVNKAIDYNKTLDTDEEEYKINIILNLKQNFERTTQQIIQYGNGETEEKTPVPIAGESLSAGTYQLFQREDSLVMDERVVKFFNQKSDTRVTKTQGTGERITVITILEYSGTTNFKTAIFECANVDYKNGRVSSMTFNQI